MSDLPTCLIGYIVKEYSRKPLNSINVYSSILSQELGGLLRKGNIDKDARSHFKSCRGGQSGDNLKMPMVVIFPFVFNGSGMDDKVIIRIVQFGLKPE